MPVSRPRLALAVGGALVGYLLLGYTVLPPLLGPLGCSGAYGDPAVDYAPQVTFTSSFDAGADRLTVTHAGGDSVTAAHTDRLDVVLTGETDRSNYSWADAGGTYPIQRGDSITIQDPMVAGRPLASGDVVRVRFVGPWPHPNPYPPYCPRSLRADDGHATRATLYRSTV